MTKSRIINPAKRHGDRKPNFIQRIVSDVIVVRATDGELVLGGFATISGEQTVVCCYGEGGVWYVPPRDIWVSEVIPQRA